MALAGQVHAVGQKRVLVLRLPDGVDDRRIAAEAMAAGISTRPLSRYFAQAETAPAGLLITRARPSELASLMSVNDKPGFVVTDMTDGLTEDVQQALKAQIPLGILGTPEDVAASVGFLASADGNYLTGQTLHVNGGMYMGH